MSVAVKVASPPPNMTASPEASRKLFWILKGPAGLLPLPPETACESVHEPVTEISPVSHGNALSVYFRDPEGNRLELFVDTPWYVKQPLRIPMDMKLADQELWAWAEAEARKQPGFKPVEEWRSALSRQMEQR